MKLIALALPDDPAMIPSWLEGQLMGLNLAQLVAELTVMRGGEEKPALSLDDFLGGQRTEILQTGLRGLSRAQLQQLLRQPQMVLELQRLILDEGGDYWMTLPASEEIHRLTTKTWDHVLNGMQDQPTVRQPRAWPLVSISLAATMAIAVLVILLAYDHWRRPPAPDLPWSNPQTWPNGSRAEYLAFLADQVETFWLTDQPVTTVALVQRLGDLRKGCSVVMVQDRTVLGAEDQEWLKDKCRSWAEKLDAERLRLETQGDAVSADVQGNVDVIVRNMVKALRARIQKDVS